jgi:hypothetical protein
MASAKTTAMEYWSFNTVGSLRSDRNGLLFLSNECLVTKRNGQKLDQIT